jgi:branched-chain amino acid transport system substrate-binding protein
VNLDGPLHDRRHLILGDDESDPTKAVMVLKKMIETEPIVALIGPTRTDTGMAMIPKLNHGVMRRK